MDWKSRLQDKRFWKKVLLWSLLLCVAPFAVEIVFLADVVGIEMALAFCAYFLKDTLLIWQTRLRSFRSGVSAGFACIALHAIGQPSCFVQHWLLSAAYFVLSGSLIWAILVWYPIVMMGSGSVAGGY
ncbi:hypothetical protein R50072_06910 [Simiduia litorea]|uniref:hypothetical protein n=1 Tax=Simiduia litorea TaxID=1435348 RepID=UPI0036F2E83B